MAGHGNSPVRRVLKRILYPLLPQAAYSHLHALSMARDIRGGTFSEPELDLIPAAVRDGENAIDVGANFGLYTYHLSRAVGPNGKVYAFEPIDYTFATLRRVLKMLGVRNAVVVPKGCADRPAKVTFQVPVADSGALSAGQAYIGRRDDDRDGKEGQVRWKSTRAVDCEIVALDEALPDVGHVALIKCDIEGAEPLAFRGAARIIAENRPTVICEINPWFLDGFGLRLEDLVGFFTERGYGFYRYDDARRSLLPVETLSDVVEDNYIFIHPDRWERFRQFAPAEAKDRPTLAAG